MSTPTNQFPAARKQRLFEFNRPISAASTFLLALAAWVVFFGLWEVAVLMRLTNAVLLPGPVKVMTSFVELFGEKGYLADIGMSLYRVITSFALACLIAVPLGILMGTFRRVEAFFNPLVSAFRYLPAPSFIPLLLMWFGAGESEKLALLFLGVVWFLITLIMDYAKSIPTDFINTALTLGGNRKQILWTVIVPAMLPNILTAMRQMLAVSWTYLVIAEIVAADSGIGAMMMRAKRFVHIDEIMAGIITIGFLGLFFDILLRAARRMLFPYLESND
ncbi:MAG: ABC transporter permease [Gammaproteobacteria bacterium]|nr:ABC transporter permease [Gammaproteobacteria bacterium]MDH3535644.1 ABC transporter permease [Gammaproteobacteria bacterium]